jgi:LPS O-antigen subunit length determinant protein (WzzB/FepE family)
MKSSKYLNDEINLVHVLENIWGGKIKIALIIFIFFVIMSIYNNFKPKNPDSFKNSLIINPAKEEEFLNFIPVYNFLDEDKIKSTKVLNKFIEEFLDYEELITVLKNNESIKKNISQLSQYDQKRKLYEYAKLFTIEKSKIEGSKDIFLKFTWSENNKEIRDILEQTLKLTLLNVKRSIFLEIDNFYEIRKSLILNKDLDRLEFLSEQSLIAKKLGLEENNADSYNTFNVPNVSFRFNSTSNNPYYMRGFKAIDMEISLIKNRQHHLLYDTQNKIKLLREKNIDWVDYNVFLLDVKQQKTNTNLPLSLIIMIGLVIGIFYVLISSAFQSYKSVSKK